MTEALRLESVSKKFVIHHERSRSFQDLMVNMFRDTGSSEQFWALKNVSFSVRKGETVGIIGQNGSGKSTILKLISRIIEPNSGKVIVNGKVSPLLELGAGFHPDLSGRDNVFLNGSILGFSRRQIAERFDEIVSFAEMEQFIDVPVKHYSSGMYTRLAFAVAINVDPDILLVDEVLAVGDEAFQEKCYERIYRFQELGKTIVFVSHSLGVVTNLCNRAVWLDHGEVRSIGESKKVVLDYLRGVDLQREAHERETPRQLSVQTIAPVDEDAQVGTVKITDVKVLDKERLERRIFASGEDIVIRLRYTVDGGRVLQDCTFAVSINERNGVMVHSALLPVSSSQFPLRREAGILEVRYVATPLRDGMYSISVAAWPGNAPESPFDSHHQVCRFSIEGSVLADRQQLEDGVVSLQHVWSSDLLAMRGWPKEILTNVSSASSVGAAAQRSNGHESVLPVDHLPTHLYMGINDEASLHEGWQEAEGESPRLRWTTGRASLFLDIPEKASTLFIRAGDPNAIIRELSGRVLANGALLGDFRLKETDIRTLSFGLPGECRGRVGITFEVGPTMVPVQMGLNDDVRELGLCVLEIWSE